MSKPDLKKCSKVLVVEGYSDLCFYAEFLQHLGLYEGVYIQDMKGRSRLEDELEVFLTPKLLAEKSHIAILLDADDDGPDLVKRIQNRLRKCTSRELVEGVWSASKDGNKLGFFVAPTPNEVGEIEDLVWQAWSGTEGNTDAAKCVESYLSCIDMMSPSSTTGRIAKRRLGSLLAVLSEDDPRLGPAAQKKLIPFEADQFKRLRDFLGALL